MSTITESLKSDQPLEPMQIEDIIAAASSRRECGEIINWLKIQALNRELPKEARFAAILAGVLQAAVANKSGW